MNNKKSENGDGSFEVTAVNTLRIGAIIFAIYWCFRILEPFIALILMGAIVAIAIYPLHLKLAARLGGRNGLSATLITLVGLAILVVPIVVLTESLVVSSTNLASGISEGTVNVTPPPDRIREWPLVGDQLYSAWQLASENISAAAERFHPQLEVARVAVVAAAGGAGAASLQMFVSIIIAGVFLGTADRSVEVTRDILSGFVGERGPLLIKESETTIRSVARGVLGVAFIEAIIVAVGLIAAQVPAAGFWAFLILVLSIVQVPPLLTLIPLILFVLSTASTFGTIVFVVCSVLAVAVDTFLKPVLLGRTADAPMLVVLLGAIGGMILWGIAGLFVGAVVLVVCWEGLTFWIMKEDVPPSGEPG